MAGDEAYRRAEEKIEKARKSGINHLDLSVGWEASEDTPRLIELPKSLAELTQLQSLVLSNNHLTALPEWLSPLSQLKTLTLTRNKLTTLPEWLSRLTQLHSLDLSSNQLRVLPESLGQLAQLRVLDISYNKLTALPQSLRKFTQLQSLNIARNKLTSLPPLIGQLSKLKTLIAYGINLTSIPPHISELTKLEVLSIADNKLTCLEDAVFALSKLKSLHAGGNQITALPDSLGNLKELQVLVLGGEWLTESTRRNAKDLRNNVTFLPASLAELQKLRELVLDNNPLHPELAAAYKEGIDAVKRYLRAKAEAQVLLNEAKLILVGEGEVGKSCLLGALRGDPWVEGRDTTHGIEIKPVKVTTPATGTEITLNGWDFGGQPIYRPTHQLFFSAPAVYLVVWKPREGPRQNFVHEWIRLVKHREPDAKIIVVATHGGPKERQPDIDRQEIWDLFGKETVIDFLNVNSKPDVVGKYDGIDTLKTKIAEVAAGLPEMGRSFPKNWQEARQKLRESKDAYLTIDRVFALCEEHKIEEEDARLLLRICSRVGDLIHYEHDPALRDIIVLKPDWLATAISYVLDDKQTREAHGLVEFARLGEVWNDPTRPSETRYEESLHPLFLRLMERFDLSYKVAAPQEPEDALSFWQRVGKSFGLIRQVSTETHYTSLIAQLVPDIRPEEENLTNVWPTVCPSADSQQVQICRITETKSGQSAIAEGLFYQLIVRLHKFSMGRVDYKRSIHWRRGLVLDDDYNGRALLEHVGNDVRITVRAPYPEAFLAVLTNEVKWLVKSFWKGMRCDVMVPCIEPCGRNAPGSGLYDVRNLIESKREEGAIKFPCPVCNRWQNIDALLRNASAAQRNPVLELLDNFQSVKAELAVIRPLLLAQHGAVMRRFDANEARILSRVDAAYAGLMRGLADEGKEGPRLFSLHPVDRSAFNPKGWVKTKFKVTLWCEHTRLPLPVLNKNEDKGVYEIDITREWFITAAPFLKALVGTLSLLLPVAASATKLVMEESAFKTIEDRLDFGKECAEAMLKVAEKIPELATEKDGLEVEGATSIRAEGGVLREFQSWLKKEDPSFGDLRRVLNKQQEFLWVHRNFEKEY